MTLPAGIIPLQERWAEGYKRDVHRRQLPPGALHTAQNLIPNHGNYALKMREGWINACSAASAGTATYAGIYAPFSAAENLLLTWQSGDTVRLWDFTSGTPSEVGSFTDIKPKQNPVFYRNLVIIPKANQGAGPKKYDGTTLADLGGVPSYSRYATVYKSRLLLGNDGGANTRRVHVSGLNATTGAPDPEVWNTGSNGDWFDLPEDITGMKSLKNLCLLFSEGKTFRLRGTTPGLLGDMQVDLLFGGIGCADAFSVTEWQDNAIWADRNGIYLTDGSLPIDLTEKCGIKKDYNPSVGESIAAGVHDDWLFVTVGSSKTYMIELNNFAAFELTNFPFASYWSGITSGITHLFGGFTTSPKAAQVSEIFALDKDVGEDADGTDIQPYLVTSYFQESPGLQRLRNLYVGYGLRKNVADSAPYVDVGYQTSPASEVMIWAGILSHTLSSDTDTARTYTRKRLPIKRQGEGVSVSIFLQGRARDFGLHSLELEGWPEGRFKVA